MKVRGIRIWTPNGKRQTGTGAKWGKAECSCKAVSNWKKKK